MKNLFFTLLLMVLLNLFADNTKPVNKEYPFNYGRMEDTVYVNPFFGLKIPIPSSWTVQNKSQIEYIFSKAKDIIEFKDEASNKILENTDVNSMALLVVYKYETGAPVTFNPSIAILAENVLMSPGVKKGADYLFHISNNLKNINLNYECNPTRSDIMKIDQFNFADLNCTLREGVVKQRYISTVIKRYAFSFIISYAEDEEEEELLSIIKLAEFK